MINLLPVQIKKDVSYARRNTLLRRWIFACVVALIGVGLIIGGGWLFMQKSIKDYEKQVTQSRESLKAQNIDEVQKQVESTSSSTKLTLQVLSREILFSKLIRQIGAALPANTTLTALQIDKVQGGIQLNAKSADYISGTQIQVNLQDPKNGVFEKADINSIGCPTPPTIQEPRPCTVSLRALFGKNNSFMFISPTATPADNQATGGIR